MNLKCFFFVGILFESFAGAAIIFEFCMATWISNRKLYEAECFINENVENVLTRIKIIISNLIESPLSQKSIHLKVCNGLDKG